LPVPPTIPQLAEDGVVYQPVLLVAPTSPPLAERSRVGAHALARPPTSQPGESSTGSGDIWVPGTDKSCQVR
jgi:hypothetical protein